MINIIAEFNQKVIFHATESEGEESRATRACNGNDGYHVQYAQTSWVVREVVAV